MNTLLGQSLLAGMFHAEDLLLPDFAPLPNRELQCTPTSVERSLNVASPFISGFAAKCASCGEREETLTTKGTNKHETR